MKQILLILFFSPFFIFGQNDFNYKRDFDKILKETKNTKSEFYYDDLLKKYNNIDNTLTDKQILALLIGFTDNKNYKPYDDVEFGKKLHDLNEGNKYVEVINTGKIFLEAHPFDLKTLLEISFAYNKTNNQKSSEYYKEKAVLILKSMKYSGNAESIETPAFALNPSDGDWFINEFLKAEITKQGYATDANGYFINQLEAIFKDDNRKTYYFITHHAMRQLLSQ